MTIEHLADDVNDFLMEVDITLREYLSKWMLEEEVTEAKHLELLDAGNYSYRIDEDKYSFIVRYSPDHKTFAEFHFGLDINFQWYQQMPELKQLFVADVSELMETLVS